jgi:hypothetical protein
VFPVHWFVAALSGWVQREQDDVIAFLQEENRVLSKLWPRQNAQNAALYSHQYYKLECTNWSVT